MLTIGIDPDISKSGVAFVVAGRIERLEALCFVELIETIAEYKKGCVDVVVKLEDVESNKAMFAREPMSSAAKMKIAQNVGMVKAVARLIRESLDAKGIKVIMVKPLKGTIKKAKKNASLFNSMTKWEGRTNEDKRDAALIALYG